VTQKAPEQTALSEKELELVSRVARRDGITNDEAATNLAKAALARRVKKRTGKPPAKVYTMRNK
jgi:hypothetical protein